VHPASGTVTQQIRPRLGRFAVAVGQRDQLLAAIRPHADHHQQAEFVFLQPDVDMNAVRPQIYIVHIRQIALSEGALLGLPLLGQLRDHRRRQAFRRAEKLAQGGHEVPARQAVQVQQRQHLGDLRGLARPRRQDRRGEPLALASVRIDALVVDPRHGHLHRARAGQHLARLVIAVAHHQPTALLVELAGQRRDVGVHLGLQRLGQHPPSTLPDDLVDQRRRTHRHHSDWLTRVVRIISRDYGEHGRAFPTDAPTSALLE
jgi:hypothetical protein